MPGVCPTDLLTRVKLAECLEVKPRTIEAWYRSGRIPGRKLSHKVVRFCLADVVAALERQSTQQTRRKPLVRAGSSL
jgi:predicted site-specific integrase-resolvase